MCTKAQKTAMGFWLAVLMGWEEFFYHDAGYGVPPRVSISTFLSKTISNIDRHFHHSLADSVAVSSNVSCFVYVGVCFALVSVYVHQTIDGKWMTFCPIEGKIPALAAVQTVCNSVVSIILDFQSCVASFLVKDTFLKRKRNLIYSRQSLVY